jgi:hypothetical protein
MKKSSGCLQGSFLMAIKWDADILAVKEGGRRADLGRWQDDHWDNSP